MALKLMYITNDPYIAVIAETAGVDRIFVDMEYIGKEKRQGRIDSVKNHHTISDIANIRKVISKSELLVRTNPIHDGSEKEINDAIPAPGADRKKDRRNDTKDRHRRHLLPGSPPGQRGIPSPPAQPVSARLPYRKRLVFPV